MQKAFLPRLEFEEPESQSQPGSQLSSPMHAFVPECGIQSSVRLSGKKNHGLRAKKPGFKFIPLSLFYVTTDKSFPLFWASVSSSIKCN